jgi:hypothetical protein
VDPTHNKAIQPTVSSCEPLTPIHYEPVLKTHRNSSETSECHEVVGDKNLCAVTQKIIS